MRLEYYPVNKLKKKILHIVGRHLDLNAYSVFFFGSRVIGKGDERSDIDIGIEGPEEISFEVMARIREEIDDLSTLYKIGIVDFKNVSAEFKKVALKQIDIISDWYTLNGWISNYSKAVRKSIKKL